MVHVIHVTHIRGQTTLETAEAHGTCDACDTYMGLLISVVPIEEKKGTKKKEGDDATTTTTHKKDGDNNTFGTNDLEERLLG